MLIKMCNEERYVEEIFDDSIEGTDDLIEKEDDSYEVVYDDKEEVYLYDEVNGEYRKKSIIQKLGQKKLTKEELEYLMEHNIY